MMWEVFGDGKLVFKYGAFITAVIHFLIMAFFVLFLIVKGMNKLMDMGKEGRSACRTGGTGLPPGRKSCWPASWEELKKQERGEVGVKAVPGRP